MGHDYAVKQYSEQGFLYIDDKADSTFRSKISVTVNDHDINYVMLKQNDLFISQLRYYLKKVVLDLKILNAKKSYLKLSVIRYLLLYVHLILLGSTFER